MTRFLPIVLVSALAAFALTPLSRRLARRTGYVDNPSARKIHLAPMPLLGGLAIYSAFLIAMLVFNVARPGREAIAIIAAVSVVALLGLWDDRFGMSPKVKLGGQVLSALVLIAGGIQISLFPWPALDVLLTVLWVVGICNAINLMDNMDGLAAGVSAVSAAFFLVVASLEGQVLVSGLAAAICGAALGFLFWNFHPATTFMGDVGSLVLGLTLAILGIKLSFPTSPVGATWMIPVLVLGVPIFDTTLVVISRIRRRVRVYLGGSDHASHRLVRLGLSHSRAVMSLYLVGALLGLTAIGVRGYSPFFANLTFAGLVLAGTVAIVLLERVRLDVPLEDAGIVIIPGVGGATKAIGAARGLSGRVTVIVDPCLGDGNAEAMPMTEVLSALADDPSAVSTFLNGQGAPVGDYANWLESANGALRLSGQVKSAIRGGQVDSSVLDAIRRASMVIIGPGDLRLNVLPTLALPEISEALLVSRGTRVLVNGGTQELPGIVDQSNPDLFTCRLQTNPAESAHELSGRLRPLLAFGASLSAVRPPR